MSKKKIFRIFRSKSTSVGGQHEIPDCLTYCLRGDLNWIVLHRAPKTIRNALMVLRGIFTVAVEQDVIQRSPVRSSHMPEIQKRQKRFWESDQVRRIIGASPAKYKTLVTVVALTGIRLGELLALQWKYVDFTSGSLLIAQGLWHGQIVPPKTESSIRRIPVGQILCEILKSHYQASAHRYSEDFIFCKRDRSPLNPDVVRKDVLYPILDRLGIEPKPRESGFHAFRHSAGSIINDKTGNLKLVQNLLGHSNLSTTADIYTYTSTKAERLKWLIAMRQYGADSTTRELILKALDNVPR